LDAYNSERKTGDEINEVKKKIDQLRAKADDAERKYVEFDVRKTVN
jgi:ATP-dependent Clp protease ATP-binding subunit ClpB